MYVERGEKRAGACTHICSTLASVVASNNFLASLTFSLAPHEKSSHTSALTRAHNTNMHTHTEWEDLGDSGGERRRSDERGDTTTHNLTP